MGGAYQRLLDLAAVCRLGSSQAVSVFGIRTKRKYVMSAVMKVAKKDLSLAELMGNAHEQVAHYRSLLG